MCQSISHGGVSAAYNLIIVYAIIKKHLDVWVPRIQIITDANPIWDESKTGWKAVKNMSQETAKLLEPIFDEHKGRSGRLSVQADPRFHRGAKKLADQIEEFHNLTCNIVVKTPVTRTGLEAIEDATSRGVSINVTVFFFVPQAAQVAEAIERGLKAREAVGYDTLEVGPVVTTTVDRPDDWLKHVVVRDGILIDPSVLEWTGIAAVRRACQIFQERGYRARMPAAALRNVNQWTEFAGGDVVVSLLFKQQRIIADSGYTAREHIADPVNPYYITELEHIPDFIRAYESDGMTVEEFEKFGPARKTLRQFLAADANLDALVRNIIVPTS